MKVTFLGTGTSTGVPEIGCKCEVCRSSNKKDKRLRASVLLNVQGRQILIDCGPDFRQQMLDKEFVKMDGVLITHEHYDHVGGVDDLRPFCRFGDVQLYGEDLVFRNLKARIPYSFTENKYPGVPTFNLNEVNPNKCFFVEDVKVQPVRLMHYKLPILGFRIHNFAYLTDLKYIPEEEYKKLMGLDILVINALRIAEHMSHQNLIEALDNIKRLAPQKAYLTHMSHQIGLHEEVQKSLPQNVYLSYDGLEIDVCD